ncbi:MAG: hypothetical protein JNL83_17470 [Myxococcales bacterium]|nr:hypothetical protein [Myxococcales bacterium]
MGAAARAALALVALAGLWIPASAECTKLASGRRYPVCFDPGNRLSVTAGSDGFGGAVALRQTIHFEDDPDLQWKLEHQIAEVASAGGAIGLTALLYRGRYVRHTRDGHLVLPLGRPRKIFLPFDIGGLVEAGRLTRLPDGAYELGIVKTAALVDLWRTRDFRRRLAFGPVARWEVGLARDTSVVLKDHVVAPFSAGIANLHAESRDGLTTADVTIEAGTAWTTGGGWRADARAEATLERIVLAVNDRPIALIVGARYRAATDEAIASVGARVVLFQAADPRAR